MAKGAGAQVAAGAGEGASGAPMVAQRQRAGGEGRPQKRQRRKDSWTKKEQRLFLETLAETCNASEAARVADVCRASAYRRRSADAAFARAWDEALDVGYAEIETLLMREVLFGSEVEELTLDGEGAVKARKVKRTRNLTVALRLLTLHRERIEKRRAEQGAAGRPDSPDAVARVANVLEAIGRMEMAADG
jgi:hypothetical protein